VRDHSNAFVWYMISTFTMAD